MLSQSRFNQGDGLEPDIEVQANGDRQARLRVGYVGSVCIEVDNGHGERAHCWLNGEEALAVAESLQHAGRYITGRE